MKPAVYLETSIIGYLAGRPSRDLIIAGRQQITRDWWERERAKYSLFISALVLQESRQGDPMAAGIRDQTLQGLPLLGTSSETEELASALVAQGHIPAQCLEDALHIALAATNDIDYLLTWNFRHINNARIKSSVAEAISLLGFTCTVICTPDELRGE